MYLTRYILKKKLIEKWGRGAVCLLAFIDSILTDPKIVSQILTTLDVLESGLKYLIASLATQITQANALPILQDVLIGNARTLVNQMETALNELFPPSFFQFCNFEGITSLKKAPDFLNRQLNMVSMQMDLVNREIEKQIQKLAQLQDQLQLVQSLRKYIQDP